MNRTTVLGGWAFALILSATCLGGGRPPLSCGQFSPFTFAIISDPQIGMVALERDRTNFAKVATAINTLPETTRPKFVLITGDLVDDANNRPAGAMFRQVLHEFSMPVYPIPGNHDVTTDGKTFAPALLASYRTEFGADRLVIKQNECLFIGLDSQLWRGPEELARQQFAWLKQQLHDRNNYRYVFVFEHHPLFLNDANEPDQYYNTPSMWRSKLLHLFEQGHVTGVLTGHLHRNESGLYHGIAMITTPSSCLNFDRSPFGYRLVSLTTDGFMDEYVSVPGTLPQGEEIDSPPNFAPVSR